MNLAFQLIGVGLALLIAAGFCALYIWSFSSGKTNSAPPLAEQTQSVFLKNVARFLFMSPLLLLWGVMFVVGSNMSYAKQGFLQMAEMNVLIFLGLLILVFAKLIVYSVLPRCVHLLSNNAPFFEEGSNHTQAITQNQRMLIGGITIVTTALFVLALRTGDLIYPHEPVLLGIPTFMVVNEFATLLPQLGHFLQQDTLEARAQVMNLLELFTILILFLILVRFALFLLLFLNHTMQLVPRFNIRFTFIDHLGLIAACCAGIILGYLPTLQN